MPLHRPNSQPASPACLPFCQRPPAASPPPPPHGTPRNKATRSTYQSHHQAHSLCRSLSLPRLPPLPSASLSLCCRLLCPVGENGAAAGYSQSSVILAVARACVCMCRRVGGHASTSEDDNDRNHHYSHDHGHGYDDCSRPCHDPFFF